MDEEYVKLIDKHLRNSIGRLQSNRLTEKWFVKNNLYFLYEEILDKTIEIADRSIGERIWAYVNRPIRYCCECGKPAKRYDNANHWSDYCSKRCSLKSSRRGDKISKSWIKNVNIDAANDKRRNTMLEKYGVEYNTQRAELKEHFSNINRRRDISIEAYEHLNNKEWLYDQYVTLNKTSIDIGKILGVYYGTVLEYCRRHEIEINLSYGINTSKGENELSSFIRENIDIITNTRDIITPFELDIYIPSRKVAIEYNGLYWHSNTDKNYHKIKREMCYKNGIRLIQITDYEWYNSQNKIKNIINSAIGNNDRIYARKCVIDMVCKEDENKFLQEYHIQGYVKSDYCIGLYFDGALVSILSLGKPRFNSKFDIEVLRYCTKFGVNIIGGLGKIIKWIDNNLKYDTIISYVDLDKFDGAGFIQCGFELHDITNTYYWTNGNYPISRFKTQKKNLHKMLGDLYDEKLSESENMINCGYRKYETSGNALLVKWIKNRVD